MRGQMPWGFREQFLGTLMTTGVFSAFLLGLCPALLCLGNELRYPKAARVFTSNSAAGLAVPMMGTVVYSLLFDILGLSQRMPGLVARSLWWLTLALALSVARGVTVGNVRSGMVGFLGVAPGLLFAGLLFDRFFLPRELFLPGSLILGGATGFSLGLGLELLKESWLEAADKRSLQPQYVLEAEEFSAGSGDHCDLTLSHGPEHRFMILERDGIHSLEVLAGDPLTVGKGGRFRYRVLADGDTIHVNGDIWVYHTRVARTRDVLPQAAV